jgi:hypothetical protein
VLDFRNNSAYADNRLNEIVNILIGHRMKFNIY